MYSACRDLAEGRPEPTWASLHVMDGLLRLRLLRPCPQASGPTSPSQTSGWHEAGRAGPSPRAPAVSPPQAPAWLGRGQTCKDRAWGRSA